MWYVKEVKLKIDRANQGRLGKRPVGLLETGLPYPEFI
jgi:hypothetical protein